EQAEVRRRHGRRRLRRQGRHRDGDDLRAARAESAPAGQVALDARGGVSRVVDQGAVAHGDRGRRDPGRVAARAQDDDAARRRRAAARAPARVRWRWFLMARHRGRGIATIEYPTGMNQNGDPSQAWIKVTPDGRIDVFAGTVDVGQGSKTVHTQIVADTIGVPYDWVTMDVSNTDPAPICTGSFASTGTFIGGNAVRFAAERVREKI